ncbi:MAG: PilZ domain-containing protein, partial [Treponema sp.]|nr:PilZ domain-containing protein [Treponema sp.]
MSAITEDSEIKGRKIFFLHPSATVQNHIVTELAQQEFEVYIVKDHKALWLVLRRHTNSVVFADIDEGMRPAEWEKWARDVRETLPDAAVGIISTNKDEDLKNKYINSVKVNCGFTVIKSDINKVIAEFMEILKTVNAKGRRKYIRATMENETAVTVNLPLNGSFINGVIRDISVVGISCAFETDQNLPKNALFKDVQIKLQSMLLNVEVIVFGARMDGDSKIYVLLFTQRIDSGARAKIRKYIQQN